MNAIVLPIRPRLRLIDESRRLAREGKVLTYVPRQGAMEICALCDQPIINHLCGCSPRAA